MVLSQVWIAFSPSQPGSFSEFQTLRSLRGMKHIRFHRQDTEQNIESRVLRHLAVQFGHETPCGFANFQFSPLQNEELWVSGYLGCLSPRGLLKRVLACDIITSLFLDVFRSPYLSLHFTGTWEWWREEAGAEGVVFLRCLWEHLPGPQWSNGEL